jgi:hypothetical protein
LGTGRISVSVFSIISKKNENGISNVSQIQKKEEVRFEGLEKRKIYGEKNTFVRLREKQLPVLTLTQWVNLLREIFLLDSLLPIHIPFLFPFLVCAFFFVNVSS